MSKSQNKNALKHGAFSETIILPEEDPKDFEDLHNSLINEWNPEGPTEEDKVYNIAKNMWRKRRVNRCWRSRIARVVAADRAYWRSVERQMDRLTKVLEDEESGVPITEQDLPDKIGAQWATYFKKNIPREKYDNDGDWLSAVADKISDELDELVIHRSKSLTIEEDSSQEEFAERELALEERVDAKIDKDIMALGRIKTMKGIGIGTRSASVKNIPLQNDTLKQIESPPTQAAEDEDTTEGGDSCKTK
jgi:hypothetical protein